jgi:hypothetical protein
MRTGRDFEKRAAPLSAVAASRWWLIGGCVFGSDRSPSRIRIRGPYRVAPAMTSTVLTIATT